MPELPEVENVRLGVINAIGQKTITGVSISRADVVQGSAGPTALLKGCQISQIKRLGKQLALIGQRGKRQPCVCIHLGMTGSLRFYPSGEPVLTDKHAHIVWRINGGKLVFRDPRRFGGLWTFESDDELWAQRWSKLGQDALKTTPTGLYEKLSHTRRSLKGSLLDQSVVAGLGNIYVDELLFLSGLNPLEQADTLNKEETRRLVCKMRALLGRAIRSGGSTIRDYADSEGRPGGFQFKHQVYGRSGEPCRICDTTLTAIQVAGRTTVYCNKCQPMRVGCV